MRTVTTTFAGMPEQIVFRDAKSFEAFMDRPPIAANSNDASLGAPNLAAQSERPVA